MQGPDGDLFNFAVPRNGRLENNRTVSTSRKGFSCLVGNQVRFYYAGADTCLALATARLDDLLELAHG
jgi:hypothetical protein